MAEKRKKRVATELYKMNQKKKTFGRRPWLLVGVNEQLRLPFEGREKRRGKNRVC